MKNVGAILIARASKWGVSRIKNDVRRSMPLLSLCRKNKKLKSVTRIQYEK